ncbi:hypothetical protein [Modestobacter marinus]|uniref:hypothetical protein n=1 Tax=Modestobacter marinus TaxID=477641 RepID=UPI001C96D5B1|nr:hypothetical protein [Modestobacter marinus]
MVTLVGMAAALAQLLGILLDRTQDLSGMSPARWYLGAVSSALWVGYGWQLGQPTMWLSAGSGLVCAVPVPPATGSCSVRQRCPRRPDRPPRLPPQRTEEPYISPSGSAMSSMRAPSGSRK